MSKVLIIEDDKILSALVKQALMSQRYTVDISYDGEEGLEMLLSNQYACAIVDWEVPNLIGPEICRTYRQRGGNTPIIMLTRRTRTAEKVVGFDSGADDYLPKPFDMEELYARLRGLMRRPAEIKTQIVRVGELIVDRDRRSASVAGKELELTKKEFLMLELLVSNPGRLFSPESIIDGVWSLDDEITVWAVRSNIARIRSKIAAMDENCAAMIKTIYGQGYKIEAPPG
ncbi:MAG: response regulator transcription factor [Candidatus Obscuribacterales bacterium]|nr:response regulator transcription factor [Candidatus Obscuribacterales bacterium]